VILHVQLMSALRFRFHSWPCLQVSRNRSPTTAFRNSCPVYARTGVLGIRWSSTQTSVTEPKPRKTWVDALPLRMRPYVLLARADKPIGTLLLFYPCGQCPVELCMRIWLTFCNLKHGQLPWLRMPCLPHQSSPRHIFAFSALAP
jgi:hypothetical protein